MKGIYKEFGCWLMVLLAPICLAQDEGQPAGGEGEVAEEDMGPFMGTEDIFNWVTEGTGSLGNTATIDVPEGMGFLNGADTDKLMQMWGNLPEDYEGSLGSEDLSWVVLFQFSADGYVKDDDKDDLDAKALMKTLKEAQKYGNEQRTKMGLDTLELEGWAVKPKYNEATNNLEWGTILVSGDGSKSVNYETRLLGREGVMNVTLLCDPVLLDELMPEYQAVLTGYRYNEGKDYASYEDGDKLAAYGLTGLIAGGALYGAAKTGLLATIAVFFKKAWKIVAVAVVGIGVGIKRFFARVSGAGN